MKSTAFSVILLLFLTSYVRSDDIEESKDEKRWGWTRCKSNDECPGNRYCHSSFRICSPLPFCTFGKCRITGTTCDKNGRYCVKKAIRYCEAVTQCNRKTECCSDREPGPSYCRKLPTIGGKCRPGNFEPCLMCSAGLKCVRRHSLYGKCVSA